MERLSTISAKAWLSMATASWLVPLRNSAIRASPTHLNGQVAYGHRRNNWRPPTQRGISCSDPPSR